MKVDSSNRNQISPSVPFILYHCGREQCNSLHSFGPAVRPHYLFHYILKGRGTFYVNGKTYYLKAGEGFLIIPGITTLYCADLLNPWEYCWIGFDGYEAYAILDKCNLRLNSPIFMDKSNGLFREQILSLIQNFANRQGNELTYLGQLYLCFSYMYQPNDMLDHNQHQSHLTKALDYIHHNYTYDIKISDLANYLSIDRTYLYKLFKETRQLSPQQYLISYRVSIAKELLKDTDLSVTEIAYSCGFKDASSFGKHFRKDAALTPLKYRNQSDQ